MKKAVTLIEILVVIAIIAIVLAVLFPLFFGASGNKTSSEDQMRQYLSTLYPNYEVVGISCTDRDTNANGYISCTATLKSPDGRMLEKSAECSSSMFNQGCRSTLPALPLNQ